MPKSAVKYLHKKHGEIWLAVGSRARELYDAKNYKELDTLLNTLDNV